MKTIKLIPRQNKPVTRLSTSTGGFNMYQKGGLLVTVPKFQEGGKPLVNSSAKHGTHGMMGGYEKTEVQENMDLSMNQFLGALSPEQKKYVQQNPERATQLYDAARAKFVTALNRRVEQVSAQTPRANRTQIAKQVYSEMINNLPAMFQGAAQKAQDYQKRPAGDLPSSRGNMSTNYAPEDIY